MDKFSSHMQNIKRASNSMWQWKKQFSLFSNRVYASFFKMKFCFRNIIDSVNLHSFSCFQLIFCLTLENAIVVASNSRDLLDSSFGKSNSSFVFAAEKFQPTSLSTRGQSVFDCADWLWLSELRSGEKFQRIDEKFPKVCSMNLTFFNTFD